MRSKVLSFFGIIVFLFTVISSTVFAADNVKPVLSNIRVEDITFNSATIRWDTDEFSTSFLDYYKAGTINVINTGQGDNRKHHWIDLSNLSSGTKYYYRVSSNDPAGNVATSAYTSFTTKSFIIPTIKLNISPIILKLISPTVTPSMTPSPSPNVTQAQTDDNEKQTEQIVPTNKPTETPKSTSSPDILISKSNLIIAVVIIFLLNVIFILLLTRNRPYMTQKTNEEASKK